MEIVRVYCCGRHRAELTFEEISFTSPSVLLEAGLTAVVHTIAQDPADRPQRSVRPIAVLQCGLVAVGIAGRGGEKSVYLLDSSTSGLKTPVHKLVHHCGPMTEIVELRNGRIVTVCEVEEPKLGSCSLAVVHVWVASELEADPSAWCWGLELTLRHDASVSAVCEWGPGRLAVASNDGVLRVWDLRFPCNGTAPCVMVQQAEPPDEGRGRYPTGLLCLCLGSAGRLWSGSNFGALRAW